MTVREDRNIGKYDGWERVRAGGTRGGGSIQGTSFCDFRAIELKSIVSIMLFSFDTNTKPVESSTANDSC